jgi:hypothetical protein
MVLLLFARKPIWRAVGLLFLITTAMSTLSTGEHYIVDLVPGLLFGCFAMNTGSRRWDRTILYGSAVLAWSLTMRFAHGLLIEWPLLVRSATLLSFALSVFAVRDAWGTDEAPALSDAGVAPVAEQA